MSYDITFIQKDNDQTWHEAMEANEKRVMALGPFDISSPAEVPPEVISEWDRIAGLLMQSYPALSSTKSPKFIELSAEETGLAVNIFENEAGISVPYWHSGESAEQIMGIVAELAKILEKETGLQGYDSQRDCRFLDSELASQQAAEILRIMSRKIQNKGI